MKRHFSKLICLVLVITAVLSLASCDAINKILGKTPETGCTEHNYVDGACTECGAADPDYAPENGENGENGDNGDETPADPVYYAISEDMEGKEVAIITITLKENNVAVIDHMYAGQYTWTYVIGDDGIATFLNEEGNNPNFGPATYSLTFENGVAIAIEWEAAEWDLTTTPPQIDEDEGGDDEGGDNEGGDNEGGADIVADAYIEDEISNTVTITEEMIAAEYAIFSFVPSYTGAYAFNSMRLYVDGVKDSKGNIVETNDSGYYELTEYSTYYVFVPVAYMTAGEYSITPEYQYPEGHYENPFYFGWDYVLGSDITVNYPGTWQTVWYSYTPEADGTITLNSDTANAIFNIGGIDYESTASLSVMGGNTYMIGIASNYEDDDWNNPACEIVFSLNFTEGEYVGNGTQITPNVLTIGTNSAVSDYCTSTYFIYKATANGTLTIESAQDLFVLQFDGQYIDEDAINGNSLHVYDGCIYYVIVSVDDWMNYVEYEFTASFKADPTEAWFEDTLVTDGSAANAIVLPDNSYVVIGVGQGTYTISWDVADAILVHPDTNAPYVNGSTITNEEWWLPVKIYLPDYAAGTVNVTISKVKEEIKPEDLVLGNASIDNKDKIYTYTATEDGVLTLSAGWAMFGEATFSYTVNGGEAQSFAAQTTVEIAVEAGDVVVITVLASSDYTSLTASFAVPPTEVMGDFQLGENAIVLEENTYVVLQFPTRASGDFQISWDNAAAIVEFKGADGVKTLSNGEVVTVGGMMGVSIIKVYLPNYAAGNVALTVSEYIATEPNPDAPAASSATGSYVGANGSGRAMKVVIDAEAGTMSIIRAALAGNSLDTASGATEATYTYAFDGTNVTVANVSGQVCTCVFDANGAPVSVIWGSATYTDFVKQ